jgi:hypothetical protein
MTSNPMSSAYWHPALRSWDTDNKCTYITKVTEESAREGHAREVAKSQSSNLYCPLSSSLQKRLEKS